jgi:ankyrin repeat protein
MLNKTKLASTPDPVPMIFFPATAHRQDHLDAEPMYERWHEIITYVRGGRQALMPSIALIACCYGFTEVLQSMYENEAPQTTRNHEGTLGIVLAVRNGYHEVLDLPMAGDSNLEVRDTEGRTALHHAAIGGYVELARYLLGYSRKTGRGLAERRVAPRSNVNARDPGQRTPLYYAAEFRHVGITTLLLAARCGCPCTE